MGEFAFQPIRLAVFLYAVFPFAVINGFCPRANVINSLGCVGSARVVPCPRLLSDVRESAEAAEPGIEEEDAEPKRVVRRERHTLFVGNLPKGKHLDNYTIHTVPLSLTILTQIMIRCNDFIKHRNL